MQIYSQVLERYDLDQLIAGFERAERSLKSWVSPAALVEIILEDACTADLDWLLMNLREFGVQWQDKPGAHHMAKEGAPAYREPGQKAPEVPDRIRRTVELLGRTFHNGLKFMKEHPGFWTDQTEAQYQGQRIKLTQEIEQAWRKAWMKANA